MICMFKGTLLLADVFENFGNMCLKIYQFDPSKFLLTDINMLLIVEKGIRRGTCQRIYRHTKATNKYMNNYDKNKESSYFQYWDVINLYG